MDINSFLSGIDKESIKQLGNVINTPMGQELMKKLKGADKSQIMRQLSSMGEGDLPREELIRQLTKNPDLIKKLNDYLDRK